MSLELSLKILRQLYHAVGGTDRKHNVIYALRELADFIEMDLETVIDDVENAVIALKEAGEQSCQNDT